MRECYAVKLNLYKSNISAATFLMNKLFAT